VIVHEPETSVQRLLSQERQHPVHEPNQGGLVARQSSPSERVARREQALRDWGMGSRPVRDGGWHLDATGISQPLALRYLCATIHGIRREQAQYEILCAFPCAGKFGAVLEWRRPRAGPLRNSVKRASQEEPCEAHCVCRRRYWAASFSVQPRRAMARRLRGRFLVIRRVTREKQKVRT